MSEQRDRWGGEEEVGREDAVEQRANPPGLSEQRDRWGGEEEVGREDAVEQRANPPGLSGQRTGVDTVEAVVRRQMAASLGGRRGMIEAAIPGALFTVLWLSTKDVTVALVGSLVAAGAALMVRLVQRSTVQYVANALFGIGLGYLFIRWAASGGGSESDQALAYFLPGILITGVYTIVMATSCLVGWPAFGFLIGSVTGDPTAWHDDRQVVQLCSRLTWLFLAPGGVNVLLQGSVYLLGRSGAVDPDAAVALLGVLRVGVGWALRAVAWSAMIWLLARNHTPVEQARRAD